MNCVYKLKLHEMKMFGNVQDALATTALRVPGGWVYSTFDKSHNIGSSVFVPWNNEFQEEEETPHEPERCSHGVLMLDRCFTCDPNIGVENRK